MVFDNDDEFGVDSFREDARYIFDANKTMVQIIRFNKDKSNYLQGDFMGIKTKTFNDNKEFIAINIMSQNSEDTRIDQQGYSGRGTIRYTCYAAFDTDISNKDIIVFHTDFNQDVQAGDKFRIEFKDFGPYQGQYCFKNFEIIKI